MSKYGWLALPHGPFHVEIETEAQKACKMTEFQLEPETFESKFEEILCPTLLPCSSLGNNINS